MRLVNRILAVLAALCLFAGGLLVAAEIAWARLGQESFVVPYDDWYAAARDNTWDSAGPRSVFLGVAVAGVVILALQLIRARPRSVPLADGPTTAGLARRKLERALASAADAEDGVAGAKAKVSRRRARVVAVTHRAEGDLAPRVQAAVQERLGAVGVDHLKVAVQMRRERQ